MINVLNNNCDLIPTMVTSVLIFEQKSGSEFQAIACQSFKELLLHNCFPYHK